MPAATHSVPKFVLTLALAVGLCRSVFAGDHGGLREALERNEVVSFKTIVDWIEKNYVGKIVEVELEDEDAMLSYEVDLLTPAGDVLEFEFDARTGHLHSVSGRDVDSARRK